MFKKFSLLVLVLAFALLSCSKYSYESVKNDPLKTRIYTLENGLKVYMTVNHEEPRIQTFIAVKVGAKNDPEQTTGLAHYFEHLMFKGTESFGTQDYAAEKPLLDSIEMLFEVYRKTEDPTKRKEIYAQIDQISNRASRLAIPNEYDKLMSAIGARGTNAWTSYDETVYTEDIPSNQIENWAKVQADRFANNVIRGFHTELEIVYEEYNMSLARDNNKAFDGIMKLLFENQPCGKHSVLGYPEHLKNPSITNIKEYYKTYYVPNNMAICLSGDFDPEEMIETIDRHFGKLKANPNLPKYEIEPLIPITEPKVQDVYGLESDFMFMGWQCQGGAKDRDSKIADLASSILFNGECGLFDIDLIQNQKVLQTAFISDFMPEIGCVIAIGVPKQGQSLEEVRDLILQEIAKFRNGDWDESLLKSTIANYKKMLMQQMDSNRGRANAFVRSFINGTNWADEVRELDELSKITKEDITEWASRTLKDNNYVVLNKRQGEDKTSKKIEKPQITPIASNRDEVSAFLKEIRDSKVENIKPVFVDFEKDLIRDNMNGGVEVLYAKNETNELFKLYYQYEIGTNDNPKLDIACSDYFSYLGTDTKTAEQIRKEFFDIACSFSIVCNDNQTYICISGISENMEKAMALAEENIIGLKGDENILAEVKKDILKSRADSKTNQGQCFRALTNYAYYGPEVIKATTLTNDQVMALSSDELIENVKNLTTFKHRVLYYGPIKEKELIAILNRAHKVSDNLKQIEKTTYSPLVTRENRVLLSQYDTKQIYYSQISCSNEHLNTQKDAGLALYNAYFGSGMNGIVFQEMREARGLAYSANARMREPSKKEETYYFNAFIATQNDKMQTAIETFDDIIENMPQSEAAFQLAKQNLIADIETTRTIKDRILWSYIDCEHAGRKVPALKGIYEKVKDMTLDDVVAYQQQNIKGRNYTYCILGDKNDIDMKYLSKLGPVEILSNEQIFGY
ncbi:MAG: insulinase family protein [Alistipes sp.]|nr:insulinase family protein [Candidatus Alistipes equi]